MSRPTINTSYATNNAVKRDWHSKKLIGCSSSAQVKLALLGPQSRFGEKLLIIIVFLSPRMGMRF